MSSKINDKRKYSTKSNQMSIGSISTTSKSTRKKRKQSSKTVSKTSYNINSLNGYSDYNLQSVSPHKQEFSNCYAHSAVRSIVRTLQVLEVIDDKFIKHFYKVFVIILSIQFGIETPNVKSSEPSYYLLKYLRVNPEDLFTIRDDGEGITFLNEEICITNHENNEGPIILGHEAIKGSSHIFDEGDNKANFIRKLTEVIPYIIIISEEYNLANYTPSSIAYPSMLMIDSLEKGLQPEIGFSTPDDLKTLKTTEIAKCHEDGNHGINIKSWHKNEMVFRNSWGRSWNFTIPSGNIAYLTCFKIGEKKKKIYANIMATHITFTNDVYRINPKIQQKIKKRHTRNPNTNFKIEDVRYRTNGNVGIYYIRMEPNAEKYLIDNRLVDVIHLTRYYVNEWKSDPEFYFEYVYISKNHQQLLEELLKKYGDDEINAQDETGSTALHYALRMTDLILMEQVIITLLRYGADLRIEDNNGKSCAQLKHELRHKLNSNIEELIDEAMEQ